jgi:hypothetical protein
MVDIRKDLLDKELLDLEIMKHKKNYLDMVVSQFTTPDMREACIKAKEEAMFSGNKERVKGLEHTIATHDMNLKSFEEAKQLSAKTVDFLNTLK